MSSGRKYAYCSCIYSNNIYSTLLRAHLTYLTDSQFKSNYESYAKNAGISIKDIIDEAKAEIERRRTFHGNSLNRRSIIRQTYKFLHDDLLRFSENFLHEDFKQLVKNTDCFTAEDTTAIFEQYLVIRDPKVYQFPIFNPVWCTQLVEECENFNKTKGLPKERPNTMNYYGVLLDEIGMQKCFDVLRQRYLSPLSKILFPDTLDGTLDSHRAFTVVYNENTQRNVDYHFDNAEVTLNVALTNERGYTGGELYFTKLKGQLQDNCRSLVAHKLGYGVLHNGLHLHGTMPVTSGTRCNLIFWMRSSSARNLLCPMCDHVPDLIVCDGDHYGDGFTC